MQLYKDTIDQLRKELKGKLVKSSLMKLPVSFFAEDTANYTYYLGEIYKLEKKESSLNFELLTTQSQVRNLMNFSYQSLNFTFENKKILGFYSVEVQCQYNNYEDVSIVFTTISE